MLDLNLARAEKRSFCGTEKASGSEWWCPQALCVCGGIQDHRLCPGRAFLSPLLSSPHFLATWGWLPID